MIIITCKTGKRCYTNKQDAIRDLQGLKHNAKKRKDKIPIRWYVCDKCGYIHLTSEEKHQRNKNHTKPPGYKFKF